MKSLRYHLMLLKSNLLGYRRRTRSGRNNSPYEGNLFHRFVGMEPVLENCKGLSVLDFGACDGLISYEYARHGARVIHGFDYDAPRIQFAQTLFDNVPTESVFLQADLAISGYRFREKYANVLFSRYDIVLFLGIFHHLVNQMPMSDLRNLVDELLDMTGRWFVVRTNMLPEFEDWILEKGFRMVSESPGTGVGVGLIKIFERSTTD